MADAKAVLPYITDLEGNYLACTETCAHCQHIPDFGVFIRPGKLKELLYFGIGQDTTFLGLARESHEPLGRIRRDQLVYCGPTQGHGPG